jgi:polyhydroxybutyrate depolymerase
MEWYLSVDQLADELGLILCYPNGSFDSSGNRRWESLPPALAGTVDDAGYLRALIEAILQKYPVDRKRVFLIGVSNGGAMCYRMADEFGDLIAGIANLAGDGILNPGSTGPRLPVNILHIHCTADDVVAYDGGSIGGFFLPSAVAAVRKWAKSYGCEGELWEMEPSLDLSSRIGGLDTTVTRYTTHPLGGAVELWTVHGEGHVIEMHRVADSPTAVGQRNTSAEQIVEWLLAHPKP